MRKLYFIAIIIMIIIIMGSFFYFNSKKSKIKLVPETGFIKNPNLIFNLNQGDYLGDKSGDWNTNGFYINSTFENRRGMIMIYPINFSTGRYLEQEIFLPPNKSYKLSVSITNMGGRTRYLGLTLCPNIDLTDTCDAGLVYDAGFKIKVIDAESKSEKIIDDLIVNSKEGWKDLSYDISNYSGKKIIIRVESYAGGPCGKWNGEWAVVDYLDVVEK